MDMAQTWGALEIFLLCMTIIALFTPYTLYLEHADIVHSDMVALSRQGMSDRRKRLRRLRLRLVICVVSTLCACAQGALAIFLAVALSRDQQTTGLRFVLFATIVAGAICFVENLVFAMLIGYSSVTRLRDLRRPAE